MSDRRLTATGSRFAIATPHTAATQAGVDAFEAGGNAIDAAIAAAVTLAVVYPHMCGVGGDLFALVQRADGQVLAVNSTGRSPAGLDPVALRARYDAMPERGPHTVTVPGAVAGWQALHHQGGALPWPAAFSPAIRFAQEGIAVARSLGATLAQTAPLLESDDGFRGVFFPGGSPLREGDTLVNPALAVTLKALAMQGPGALYDGPVGRAYAQGLRTIGSSMAPEDLASHAAELLSPLVGRYRDIDVRVTPPTSQGFVLLELLACIERLGIDPDPFGPDAGTIALVALVAARDRDLHLADPLTMRVHPHALLDEGHIAALCDLVRAGRIPSAHPSPTDTVGLVTTDADGLAVSLIQSLSWGFGAGILEPTTGIIAQNRGSGFTFDREHPNTVEPAKRPAHTLMPVMAHRAGRLAAVSGTMGGAAHPQINAWSLIRALDLELRPLEAVRSPRWLVNGMDAEGPEPFVLVEAGVPPATATALRGIGLRVDPVADPAGSVGHAHLILVRGDGSFEAATDPRADGAAIAT